jgi:uncharacterized membrane protein
MLIVFPVGLFIFSLVCDLIGLRSADPETWAVVAFYAMVGGFIGALAAAIPGLIDLLSLAEQKVKKIALTHMSLNLLAVALYAANIWLRWNSGESGTTLLLSVLGVAVLAVSGWLGGEMVHRHGVGVDTTPEPALTGSTSVPDLNRPQTR